MNTTIEPLVATGDKIITYIGAATATLIYMSIIIYLNWRQLRENIIINERLRKLEENHNQRRKK